MAAREFNTEAVIANPVDSIDNLIGEYLVVDPTGVVQGAWESQNSDVFELDLNPGGVSIFDLLGEELGKNA
jgi:hypothetical protein